MFGSHLSIAGGMHNALLAAEKYGMETVQVFTKNQQQWAAKPLDPATIKFFRDHALLAAEKFGMETVQVFTKNQQQWACKPLGEDAIKEWAGHRDRLKFSQTVSHDSYLINLASTDEGLWAKSVDAFVEELSRCV